MDNLIYIINILIYNEKKIGVASPDEPHLIIRSKKIVIGCFNIVGIQLKVSEETFVRFLNSKNSVNTLHFGNDTKKCVFITFAFDLIFGYIFTDM